MPTLNEYETRLKSLASELSKQIQSNEFLLEDWDSFLRIVDDYKQKRIKLDQFQKSFMNSALSNFDLSEGSLIDELKKKYQTLVENELNSLIESIRKEVASSPEPINIKPLEDLYNYFKTFLIRNVSGNNAVKKFETNFPEMNFLKGPAESSPAGTPQLSAYSFAYLLFKKDEVDPTAIEIDRTSFGIVLFLEAISGNKDRFPGLDEGSFNAFRSKILEQPAQTQFMVYAMLATNDLAKAYEVEALYQKYFGKRSIDHDQSLGALLVTHPEHFEGFQRYLSASQQEIYIRSLVKDTNNLEEESSPNFGQNIQAENSVYEMEAFYNMPESSRIPRFIEQLLDIAGATGQSNPFISIIMNTHLMKHILRENEEVSKQRIITGKEVLDLSDFVEVRLGYLAYRAHYTGLTQTDSKEELRNNPELRALARLIALLGINDEKAKDNLVNTLNALSNEVKNTLIEELNETGINDKLTINLYWFPQMLKNAMANSNAGLIKGLEAATSIYEYERKKLSLSNGSYVVKVNGMALEFTQKDGITDYEKWLDLQHVKNSETKMKTLYKHKQGNFYVLNVSAEDAQDYEEVSITHLQYREILATASMFYQSSSSVPAEILDSLPPVVNSAIESKEEKDNQPEKLAGVEPGSELKKHDEDDDTDGHGNNPGAPGNGPAESSKSTATSSANQQSTNNQQTPNNSGSSDDPHKNNLEVCANDYRVYDIVVKATIPAATVAATVIAAAYSGDITNLVSTLENGNELISSAIESTADFTSSFVSNIGQEGIVSAISNLVLLS